MFGFGQKQKVEESTKVENVQPQGVGEVYVMPEKYIVQGSKGGNKGLIIASIILLIVIAITGGYLAYDMLSRQPAAITPTPEPPKVENIEQPIMEPEPVATTTLATTTEAMVTTTAPTSTPVQAGALKNSIDSDNDGLTDVEETIFGTAPTNPDTDGDGYKDGVEVVNGYNPTKPGTSKLNESPFIVSLTTNFGTDDFQVMYPKEWQTSMIKSGQQLLMTAPSGEIIKIFIRENQTAVSALAWYLQDHPEAAVSQLKIIATQDGQLSGIYTPDGSAAYLTDASKTKFYVFEYLIGRQTEIRYPGILNMIIKSVKVLPKTSAVNPIAVFNNTANLLLKSQCTGGLTFCAASPCGTLADGSNSCSDDSEGYCYSKECKADTDCVTGKTCQPFECFNGDAAVGLKLCK